MNISDPIADMLTRVRNASRARHTEVLVPASRTKREIARILKSEGFIAEVSEEQAGPGHVLKLCQSHETLVGRSLNLILGSLAHSPVAFEFPR